MTEWYQIKAAALVERLGTDVTAGLSDAEVASRLSEYGRNELTATRGRSAWLILWDQLKSLLVVMLIVAALVSALLRDYIDAIAIAAIVVLNALLGFIQEYRAEKAILALKSLAVPFTKVRRGGEIQQISATLLVPGDIVLLEAGNLVAADCRILEDANLQTQEAALTGESQPVDKNSIAIESPDAPLGDRRNMAYMGTFITTGRGLAVVTDTGMRTQLGHIAGMIRSLGQETTPLQRKLGQLGKQLAAVAAFLVALIFILGWIRGENLKLLFLTSVSIGVAAVPEGLPAVVTIALTLGAQRMLRRKALIRNLSAVETLGSITVICSDKTGTLTENHMAVVTLQLADRKLELPANETGEDKRKVPESLDTGLALLLTGGALCNDAVVQVALDDASATAVLGDPTETALLAVARRFGLDKEELERALPRIGEVPFTSERKRMTTIHNLTGDGSSVPYAIRPVIGGADAGAFAFTKGSAEVLLNLCNSVWVNGNRERLDQTWRERLDAAHDKLAANGMRILGVAFRCLGTPPPPGKTDLAEQDLTFVGMLGMIDPPRPEAASAVATCRAAGIRLAMITGDHPLTAQYIARQLGIQDGEGTLLAGPQLSRMSAAELDSAVDSTHVFARVSPEHKLKIVESLQRRGHVVAMTGDGVNDAPALKKADIGVAMGVTGTDVAKEAADMVLLDDNFATLVAAVGEGRVIYDNIRKFIKYILATNSGEIWVMLVSPFFGMPLALLPLQILWMNLMTDGLPALALSIEPPELHTMSRPPYSPDESIFARGLGRHVLWVGLLMGCLSLGIGYAYWQVKSPQWQTMVFTTLTLSQLAHVMAIRSERHSLFRIGLLSNRFLLAAVFVVVVFQLILVYATFAQKVFQTTALSVWNLTVSLVAAAVIFLAVETEKWFARRWDN